MKIEITYITNEHEWALERIAREHGYELSENCYWCQILTDASDNVIVLTRAVKETECTTDPLAALTAALDGETVETIETADSADSESRTTHYTEFRDLNAADVRRLCIQKNYYSRGTNEQYAHLLFDLIEAHGFHFSADDLAVLAADILDHTDRELHPDLRITDIMYDLSSVSTIYFETAD